MTVTRRRACLLGLGALAAGRVRAMQNLDAAPESGALHVLNRLAYGPAPGDLARVMLIGPQRYIAEQLQPERLPLPAALQRQLDGLESTHWSQHELITRFRDAQKAVRTDSEQGKAERRALYQGIALQAGEARLLRAMHSPAQLQEVMVEFWFNHFNVYVGKGLDRVLVENYEREAIRPHAFGRFRDLLGATAKHPAMLFYLDNWLSAAPGYRAPGGKAGPGRASGLNENYARELMELHTLGVDGGYSQTDVSELARMLTGWTFEGGNRRRSEGDSTFRFDAARHDGGDKLWLGRRVVARGQAEGEEALDVLAAHPATAHHLAFQLSQYFVQDDPSTALVQRVAQRFRASGGDIRAVLQSLFDSPEFQAPQALGVKFKTPYRYLVSTLRACDLPVSNVRPLLATAYQLGMPLYGCQTPDGYKNTEQAWLNPDAITRRVAFATAFASGRLPLARPVEDEDYGGMGKAAMQRAIDPRPNANRYNPAWSTPPVDAQALLAVLGSSISGRTRATVAQSDTGLRAALVLGSPDFMRY
ncbi:MAG: DUF1800 domain-containing protein [Burkholderiaceae bacterium]